MPHFFRREKKFSKIIQKAKKRKEKQIILLSNNLYLNIVNQISDSVKNTSIN